MERQDAPTLREQTKIRLSEGGEETDREVAMAETVSGDETADTGERIAARRAAEEYYGGTVFEVVSMREKQVSKEEMVFLVSVKKDGILQEPDRTILLQKQGEEWVVANEGY